MKIESSYRHFVLDGHTDRHYDTLSSCRGQKGSIIAPMLPHLVGVAGSELDVDLLVDQGLGLLPVVLPDAGHLV